MQHLCTTTVGALPPHPMCEGSYTMASTYDTVWSLTSSELAFGGLERGETGTRWRK